MPTLEEARELADNFERAYPEELPDQLAWWSKVLGLSRSRLLRIMGLSPIEIQGAMTQPWSKVIEAKSKRAGWVEELLGQLLATYSYDWQVLSADLLRERNARRASGSIATSSTSKKFSSSSWKHLVERVEALRTTQEKRQGGAPPRGVKDLAERVEALRTTLKPRRGGSLPTSAKDLAERTKVLRRAMDAREQRRREDELIRRVQRGGPGTLSALRQLLSMPS